MQLASPDAVIMRTAIGTFLAILTAALLLKLPELPKPTLDSVVGQVEISQPVQAQDLRGTSVPLTKQSEAPVPTPPAPAPAPPEVWDVASSPHARVSVDQINQMLALFKAKGVTKQGAAYLTGNFIAESYLLPCAAERGDGGLAWGLAQWHPGRRADMPCELAAQVDWAIDVEMPRDAAAGRYRSLKDVLYDPNAGRADFLQGFKQWERYGVEGNRAVYGDAIMSQL